MVNWKRVSDYMFKPHDLIGKINAVRKFYSEKESGIARENDKAMERVLDGSGFVYSVETTAVSGAGLAAIDKLLHYAIDHGMKPEMAQNTFNASIIGVFSLLLVSMLYSSHKAEKKYLSMFEEKPCMAKDALNSLIK